METGGNMNPALTDWQLRSFIPAMEAEMESMHTPVFHYVAFRKWHDPRSGIAARVSPPMLSQGYTVLRNRPGLLIETHMLKDYKTRVEASYNLLAFTLKYLSENGKLLQNIIMKADKACVDGSLLQSPFPLKFDLSSDSTILMFKGFEYKTEKSDLTGGEWFRYSDIPIEFPIPFFNKNNVSKSIKPPFAYIVPPQYSELIERIKAHGISYKTSVSEKNLAVRYYYISNVTWSSTPYEGRIRINNFIVKDTLLERSIPEGSLIIPVNQHLGKVVIHLFEPEGPDSYISWGFFNTIFEQKEYAENYVMEKMAAKMLENDTLLKQEFEIFKAENPEIIKNQWGLLNWFYHKTPWRDENMNIYPIGRVFDIELLNKL
jgi:hypothetical protein